MFVVSLFFVPSCVSSTVYLNLVGMAFKKKKNLVGIKGPTAVVFFMCPCAMACPTIYAYVV